MRFADLMELGVSSKQIAFMLDIPGRTVRDWQRDPTHPHAIRITAKGEKFFRFQSAIQFIVERYRKINTAPPKGKLSAEIALLEARARREQIKAGKEAKELIPVDLAMQRIVKQSAAVKQSLDSLPKRLAPRLATMTDPHEIDELLSAEINRALSGLPDKL